MNERAEDEVEGNAAGNSMQPARNPGEQARGEVKTIFEGGNGWGNKSVPTSALRTLGIPGGTARRRTQQATLLPAGRNAPKAGIELQDIHRALIGGNCTLHSTARGGNGIGGATGTEAAPEAGH